MTSLMQNAFTFNPKVNINFDGGNLTSNAGFSLLSSCPRLVGLDGQCKNE